MDKLTIVYTALKCLLLIFLTNTDKLESKSKPTIQPFEGQVTYMPGSQLITIKGQYYLITSKFDHDCYHDYQVTPYYDEKTDKIYYLLIDARPLPTMDNKLLFAVVDTGGLK